MLPGSKQDNPTYQKPGNEVLLPIPQLYDLLIVSFEIFVSRFYPFGVLFSITF